MRDEGRAFTDEIPDAGDVIEVSVLTTTYRIGFPGIAFFVCSITARVRASFCIPSITMA
jgi:hypothetical protein